MIETNSSMQDLPSIKENLKPRDKLIKRIKRRLLRHVWPVRVGLVLGAIGAIYLLIILLGFIFRSIGITNYFRLASNFIFTPASQIKSQDGRTNVLILGKSGLGFSSPDLTDTIIFSSISHTSSSAVMVSLPRDIWIPAIRAKLNSAYYWGGQKEEKGGLTLAKSVVEEIVGQPVHYGIVVDFSAFKKIIDVIGGIEVTVDRDFVDNKYPIAGKENDECGGDKEYKCRYETIGFHKSLIKMDGETALKFVRSRNAEGEEGTDLAREERQQKVITSLKNKVISPAVLLSPRKLFGIWKEVRGSVETDIEGNAGAIIVRRILELRNNFISSVIPADFLVNPTITPRYDNQYVFLPKEGNWSRVQEWISCKLYSNCQESR